MPRKKQYIGTITALGKERLEKIIEFIEKVPRDKFNYAIYGDCNTRACAWGHVPRIFPETYSSKNRWSPAPDIFLGLSGNRMEDFNSNVFGALFTGRPIWIGNSFRSILGDPDYPDVTMNKVTPKRWCKWAKRILSHLEVVG